MKDVMIDIETLGLRPGSVLLSVGAVEFDAETGEFGRTFYERVSLASCIGAGLTIDADTLAWWMKQSEAARNEAFGGAERISIAMLNLRNFMNDVGPDRVWAKPPQFDIAHLEVLMDKFISSGVPWDHRAVRDCRTLFDVTQAKAPDVGTAHNALDDALSQAHGVVEAYRIMREEGFPFGK